MVFMVFTPSWWWRRAKRTFERVKALESLEGEVLAAARKVGYIVASRNPQERRWADRWYRECFRTERPYVRVIPRRARAAVELDMDPTGWRLSQKAKDAEKLAIEAYWVRVPLKQRGFIGRGNFTQVSSLPREDAETLAGELVKIVRRDLGIKEL